MPGVSVVPGRKSTQRERLLTGLITTANRDGYAGANVSAVIAEAGVSRPTFYDYFSDRDDCFLTAVGDVERRLLAEVRADIRDAHPEHALAAAVGTLVRFASCEPEMARFLTNEPMAAGPRALDARDRGIAAIERLVEERYEDLDPATPVPDFSSRMLIGGTYRVLASRLRRGEPNLLSRLLADLQGWIELYQWPIAQHRWRALQVGAALAPSPFVPSSPLAPPQALAAGRSRMPAEEVAENQRQRIMFAAARLAEEKGYNATTIGDITKSAQVDGRVFYGMFADKQEAFMAVHEMGFQRVMEVTAGAFFAGSTWTERNWEAGRAFTQFLESNPMIANVGFVEASAVGPGALQRVEDSHTAFAMLFAEGYQHIGVDAEPPRLALEAIVTTIFETVYHQARAGEAGRLSGLVAQFSFLVLAPFIGVQHANAFIDHKLDEARVASAAPSAAAGRRSSRGARSGPD
jgi:AcrR family transcriptional regulator